MTPFSPFDPVMIPVVHGGVASHSLLFIGVWLLLGWFLLRRSRSTATPTGGTAGPGHRHDRHRADPRRVRILTLALVGIALYALLRSWRSH